MLPPPTVRSWTPSATLTPSAGVLHDLEAPDPPGAAGLEVHGVLEPAVAVHRARHRHLDQVEVDLLDVHVHVWSTWTTSSRPWASRRAREARRRRRLQQRRSWIGLQGSRARERRLGRRRRRRRDPPPYGRRRDLAAAPAQQLALLVAGRRAPEEQHVERDEQRPETTTCRAARARRRAGRAARRRATRRGRPRSRAPARGGTG